MKIIAYFKKFSIIFVGIVNVVLHLSLDEDFKEKETSKNNTNPSQPGRCIEMQSIRARSMTEPCLDYAVPNISGAIGMFYMNFIFHQIKITSDF
jgi:hypothetical protein